MNKIKNGVSRYIKSDLIVALAIAAISIPESLGFAAIAGVPPIMGLYTALISSLVFGIFAKSRRAIVGTDLATATLIAGGATLVAQAGTVGYMNAIYAITIMTGIILLLLAFFRLGFLAQLISRPVLVGFFSGIGIQLIVMQLPKLLGISGEVTLLTVFSKIFNNVSQINMLSITIAICVIGMIVIFRKSKIPIELLGVVAATVVAVIFDFSKYGVRLLGDISSSTPGLKLMLVDWNLVVQLFPVALGMALVILAQGSSVIRIIGRDHDDEIKLNTDLRALGLANVLSGLFGGFASNVSTSRSFVAERLGMRTKFVNIYVAILIGAVLFAGSSLLSYVPYVAIASVIFVIGFRLVKVRELMTIYMYHPAEFFVSMTALFCTAFFGAQVGILAAVIVSLVERLSRQYRPNDAILLRDGKLSKWASERLKNEIDNVNDDLLIYSFDGDLFFENADYFVSRIERAVSKAKKTVSYVMIDAGAISDIDYTAVKELKGLYRRMSLSGITLGLSHVSPNLRDEFDAYGVTELVGKQNMFPTLVEGVLEYSKQEKPIIDRLKKVELDLKKCIIVGSAAMELRHLRRAPSVDVLVTNEYYDVLRKESEWREYGKLNGERYIARKGVIVLDSWSGSDYNSAIKNIDHINSMQVMGIDDLVENKQKIGRKTDIADIELLLSYKKNI